MLSTGPLRSDATVTLAFALVHLFAGRLGFGGRIPRSRWLSVAGGVSVAYVFVHLLPEVGAAAATLEEYATPTGFAEEYGYLIALLGFVVFYGLERLVRRANTDSGRGDEPAGIGLFWVHVGSFAVYNGIVGYLLWDRELGGLLPFAVAMALHFLVTDDGLREHHGRTYHRRGRWVLSAAVLAGFAAGYVLERRTPRVGVPAVSGRRDRPQRDQGGTAVGAREPILGVRGRGGGVRSVAAVRLTRPPA